MVMLKKKTDETDKKVEFSDSLSTFFLCNFSLSFLFFWSRLVAQWTLRGSYKESSPGIINISQAYNIAGLFPWKNTGEVEGWN